MTQKNKKPKFRLNPEERMLTNSQKQALLVGVIPSIRMGFFTNSLAIGIDKEQLHHLLTSITHPKPPESIIEKLDFLHCEGDRTAYSILLPTLLLAQSQVEAEAMMHKMFFGINQFIHQVQNIYQFIAYMQANEKGSITAEDLKRGVLAWDMGELIALARIAYETQYIDEETSWREIEYANKMCQEQFQCREDIYKSYLIGQAIKCNERAEYDQILACFAEATAQIERNE